MKKKYLTVIIPFLNEGEEVEKTIESILTHSNNDVDIIIINDASDDGYNYQDLSTKYPIQYFQNTERKGVATSRNIGVDLCSTSYFLLLDAHMRFYDCNWVNTISSILSDNPKYLLCCQTKALKKDENNVIHESNLRKESFGACVDLFDPNYCFSAKWVFKRDDINDNETILNIPCVLGAGYACSKEYWKFLRGLEGLMYYGYDETYLSMKVWLSGGQCKLLRNVVIGHIYRIVPPYQTGNYFLWYNTLLVNALLVPEKLQKVFISRMQSGPSFAKAYKILYKNEEKLNNLKQYYNTIFTEKYSFFEKINEQFGAFENIIEDEDALLKELASYLVLRCQSMDSIGLFYGKMGVVIFLFHYSRHVKCKVFEDLAGELLDNLCSSLDITMPYFLQSGLAGIGWAIEYLHQKAFIKGNTDEILEVIDEKIKEVDISKIKNLTIGNGLGGIVHYIMARIYAKNIERQNIFEAEYLQALYNRLIQIIQSEEETDAIDIFFRYIDFYERKKDIIPLSIYDIVFLYIPKEYKIENYSLGLHSGGSNIGLKLIFENNNKKYVS